VEKDSREITILLHRWTAGDRLAEEELFRMLMPDLKRIAGRCLSRDQQNYHKQKNYHKQRTELVNDLYIKLAEHKNIDFVDRNHFFAICTIKIRRILIDEVRIGKLDLVDIEGLPEGLFGYHSKLELVLAVNDLLDELEKKSVQRCCVIVLRSYLGCGNKETASLLGITENVAEHEYYRAKKWLYERLGGEPPWQAASTTPNK